MTSEFAKLFKTPPPCQYFNNTTGKLSSFQGLGGFILKLGVDAGGGTVSPVLWLLQRRKAKHRLQNKFRRLALSSSRLLLDYLGDQWRSHLPHHHPNPECTGGPIPLTVPRPSSMPSLYHFQAGLNNIAEKFLNTTSMSFSPSLVGISLSILSIQSRVAPALKSQLMSDDDSPSLRTHWRLLHPQDPSLLTPP